MKIAQLITFLQDRSVFNRSHSNIFFSLIKKVSDLHSFVTTPVNTSYPLLTNFTQSTVAIYKSQMLSALNNIKHNIVYIHQHTDVYKRIMRHHINCQQYILLHRVRYQHNKPTLHLTHFITTNSNCVQ